MLVMKEKDVVTLPFYEFVFGDAQEWNIYK